MKADITAYFDNFDPYFENPFLAVFVEGFHINELIAEYRRVFGENWETQIDADYAVCCSPAYVAWIAALQGKSAPVVA